MIFRCFLKSFGEYLFDDLYVEVIADGCHIPSNLFELIYKIKGSSRICLVTDAMRCAGSEKKESHIGGVPCIIENGVAFLTDKSAFAGSIATTDRLVRFCVKDVGIRIEEAVKMVSEVPAKYLGLNKGIIEKNKDADFVIFDDNINVKKIICRGKLKYGK